MRVSRSTLVESILCQRNNEQPDISEIYPSEAFTDDSVNFDDGFSVDLCIYSCSKSRLSR